MYRVLLVDDEESVLKVLKTSIDWLALGVDTPVTAADGVQALEAMERSPFHLLIADIKMPRMGGLELIRRVRQLYPETRCILLTAYSEFDYAKEAIRLGVENYLLKPVQKEELESTVQNAMANLYSHRGNGGNLLYENILHRWLAGAISGEELSERAGVMYPYLRALIGGSLVLLFTFLTGSQAYNGIGADVIADCIEGNAAPEAFLLKMIFTAVTLAAGYKGGELVPTLFVGASFGCLIGGLLGLSPSLGAAVGMGALFCGVPNAPITSLLICLELFGMDAAPFLLLAVAVSYTVSGYYGLYNSQRIVYSKYKSDFINKKTE